MWFKKSKVEEPKTLNECIDFTMLDPRAIQKDAETMVNIAVKNGYRAVVVNPCMVRVVRLYMENKLHAILPIVAAISFPLGASSLQIKIAEIKQAIADGADELDVVINIGHVKEGDFSSVKNELNRIVRIARGKTVKAIIETCYLSRDEIRSVCKLCVKAKVDYIMTSTGYGTGGATTQDVALIKEIVGEKCLIKAAGGIRTKAAAEQLMNAGANLIGTSKIL